MYHKEVMKKGLLFSFLGILLFFFLFIYISPTYGYTKKCIIDIGTPVNLRPPGCENRGGNGNVVALAKTQYGKPYLWGGSKPASAWPPNNGAPNYDCSSFASWAWYWATDGKVNLIAQTDKIWLDESSGTFEKFIGSYEELKDQLQAGDLLFWGSEATTHHMAIYMGQDNECGKDPKNEVSGSPADDCYIAAPRRGEAVRSGRLSGNLGDFVGFLHVIQ